MKKVQASSAATHLPKITLRQSASKPKVVMASSQTVSDFEMRKALMRKAPALMALSVYPETRRNGTKED